MSDSLNIRKLIERVSSGDIRIPAFQREYVWNPDQVAFLLDSLYKGFPIGIISLWKTDERLRTEKDLGQFSLPAPRKDYPVNYVLDGQQRLTSLFSVFQTELPPVIKTKNAWVDIYFDLDSNDHDFQNSYFFALTPDYVDLSRHFPMNTMFDSAKYRAATENLSRAQIIKIDKVQEIFKEVQIPIQTLETDEKGKVAIVFERINRSGTELDTYQLLTAWSWSENFDLSDEFEELSSELEPFGFDDLIENKYLQLKCCSAVISKDATPSAVMNLNGKEIRDSFKKVKNGIKSSIDFLKKQLFIQSLAAMPYSSMLIPLTFFFADNKINGKTITNNQREQLIKWFWRSNFSRRYSSSVDTKHQQDFSEFQKLKNDPNYKINIQAEIPSDFFTENQFRPASVNTKIFILMLAQNKPKAFISGNNIDLEKVLKQSNSVEFHHIFPKKFLKDKGVDKNQIQQLANFCFLDNADNQKIKSKSPSTYKKIIDPSKLDEIMKHALCPIGSLDMDYSEFITKRSEILLDFARNLIS
ncbi:GmrSD restriction endonuclease domain-containing protein [Neisseria mucosa]|mgnify:FL=1|uniref:GmrSD restriction endonuclease domain-containing protein n=1 Tax=Neisseria mucosa TaxID=488 RepID=UPI00280B50A2|nr:DUF262 domain-containing protein [Neisseria mucosa]